MLATVTATPTATTRTAARRPRSLARRAAAALLVAGSIGVAGALPAFADAVAGEVDTYSAACFQQTDGGPFTGAIQAEVWTDQGWLALQPVMRPSENGCLDTYLAGGYTYRYSVAERFFSGSSNPQDVFYGGSYRFDTVVTWRCDPSRIERPVECGAY